MHEFELCNEVLQLLPEKAIYWPAQKALLIADPHFGKITHFRKAGLNVPQQAAYRNFARLDELLKKYQPEHVYFLGDLFHSSMNSEWLIFKELLQRFPQTELHLIMGNHDVLHEINYTNSHFKVHENTLELGPFLLSHEPLEEYQGPLYNLSGHLHPGVRLQGKARQRMRFPCFYFGEWCGVLPAFGEFTGLYIINPKKSDHIFINIGEEVIAVS